MELFVFQTLPVADVFYAFRESTFPGKAIVLILVLGSILAWTIMISKWMELRRALRRTGSFISQYRTQPHPVSLYLQQKKFTGSPPYFVYEAACHAIGRELDLADRAGEFRLDDQAGDSHVLSPGQLDAVTSLADRNVAEQVLSLEANMNLLATAVSSAPFLGLLGTVWGVMDGFGAMAVEGAATLSAVAPGISAALLTTVIGLLVALPSAIGYNILIGKIRTLTVQLETFTDEFSAAVRRAYGPPQP